MIVEMIVTIALFINALLVHEFFHLWVGTKYNPNTFTIWRKGTLETHSRHLTKIQKINMIWAGVLAGYFALLPILGYMGDTMFLLLTAVYLYGCKWDLKLMWRLLKCLKE